MLTDKLTMALSDPKWITHRVGDTYRIDKDDGTWKLSYYPIFEDGKNHEQYVEPKALMEKPIVIDGVTGTDFREMPLRFIHKL